ncbi:hypothetical protein [Dyella marensis]|uniref:hypothetical protein n=1 Tax=Dyella marensis TaxID=500610 RepID=UPI0031E404AC
MEVHALSPGVAPKQGEIVPAILIVDEGGASIDAAMDDMERDACHLDARASWHGGSPGNERAV